METPIREYGEEMPVEIEELDNTGRLIVSARNEAGCNGTLVDLIDVLKFVKENMPDLWNSI
jgi:hypothetical protein